MIKIPKLISNFLKRYKYLFILISEFQYDLNRYKEYSATLALNNNYDRLIGRIIAHYHVVEKGLSLPSVKYGFGKDVIFNLILLMKRYENTGYDVKNISYQAALGSIESYIEFHYLNNELGKIFDVQKKFSKFKESGSKYGGTFSVSKGEILAVVKRSKYDDFFNSRHSVRSFSNKNVDVELLKSAVRLAQKAPSVCNRQSAKVHIVSSKNLQKKIFNIHVGNRGFGEGSDKLIIVTSDLSYFTGVNERNQSFIDGGIFLMSLLNALHFKNLSSCALNWSASSNQDKLIRNIVPLNDSENIIALIAVGHYRSEFKVAQSSRKSTNEIVKVYS